MKIFDCSINDFADKHRDESLGPKENDMMFDLKKYQDELYISFVSDYREAEVIITNTTYTPAIIKYANENKIVKIKRMDGIFWRNDLIDRNVKLNEAALQSDAVIFISKFSQDSFSVLYPDEVLTKEYVILNNVDESIFKENEFKKKKGQFMWGASATNWNRKEKRPDDLIKFADFLTSFNEKILLIGKSNIKHPSIINAGYFEDYNELNNVINGVNAWVNFSYMDAAPKTVLQAIKCGKPVLYADSGGISELVGSFGVAIPDNKIMSFEKNNYKLNFDDVISAYVSFKFSYNDFLKENEKKYIDTLLEYVTVFKNTLC